MDDHINGQENQRKSNGDFVSSVSIDTWKKKDGLFGYTTYILHCELMTKKAWTVERRYKQFLELHEKLIKKIPEVATFMFPEKTWFNCTRTVIYYRAYLFEDYLRDILGILPRPVELDEFLEVSKHLRQSSPSKVHLSPRDFHLLHVIGQGAYGVVFLVRPTYSKKNDLYAMKVLKKDEFRRRGQLEHAKTEQKILEMLHHPFIIRMHSAFQSADKMYMVLEYCKGGELYKHLKSARRFSELVMRFYCLELCLALEFLHSQNIIFRDLKPENILLNADGHIKLTDFGLAKLFHQGQKLEELKASTFCGTPEYLAPEMLMNKLFKVRYGHTVDWWTYGVVCYEMVVGKPPYKDKSFSRLCRKILKQPLRFPKNLEVSADGISFIEELLRKNAKNRLGCQKDGLQTLKEHPFLKGTDWDLVQEGKLQPPIIPAQIDILEKKVKTMSNPKPKAAGTSKNLTTRPSKQKENFVYQLAIEGEARPENIKSSKRALAVSPTLSQSSAVFTNNMQEISENEACSPGLEEDYFFESPPAAGTQTPTTPTFMKGDDHWSRMSSGLNLSDSYPSSNQLSRKGTPSKHLI